MSWSHQTFPQGHSYPIPAHQAPPPYHAPQPSYGGNWDARPSFPAPAFHGSYNQPASYPVVPYPAQQSYPPQHSYPAQQALPPQSVRQNSGGSSDFGGLNQATNNAFAGVSTTNLVASTGLEPSKNNVTLAADAQAAAMSQMNPALSREQRMYNTSVSQLGKIIEAKYRGQLVSKRGNSESVAFIIHRHCEAMRMQGSVAEQIISTTNAMLEDGIFDVDQMYQRLNGGDYYVMQEAVDFVKQLVIVFQKEAVSIYFPTYLQQQMQAQQYAQSQYAQTQREERPSRQRKQSSDGCTIM